MVVACTCGEYTQNTNHISTHANRHTHGNKFTPYAHSHTPAYQYNTYVYIYDKRAHTYQYNSAHVRTQTHIVRLTRTPILARTPSPPPLPASAALAAFEPSAAEAVKDVTGVKCGSCVCVWCVCGG